jgi:hypothetical protein
MKTFTTVDGDRVALHRHQVLEAYVDATETPSTIVLVADAHGTTRVGIGALEAMPELTVLDEVQAWLGITLPTLTIVDGAPSGHRCGLANIPAAKHTWPTWSVSPGHCEHAEDHEELARVRVCGWKTGLCTGPCPSCPNVVALVEAA